MDKERKQYFYLMEAAEQEKARDELVEKFKSEYDDFFNPTDPAKRLRPGVRVLSGFDLLRPPEPSSLHLHYKRRGLNIILPYANLDERIIDLLRSSLASENTFFSERWGSVPELRMLPEGFSTLVGKEMYLKSVFFYLKPSADGAQRFIERMRVFADDNERRDPVGEIWIGKKSGIEEAGIDQTPADLIPTAA